MNIKGFFVTALSQALELGIATPDDVLRHVTPEILADHLPRPLWARLITACMGAPRVDSQLVVETIGVPNLCEHMPSPIIWRCIQDIAQRSLGQDGAMPLAPSASTKPSILTKPVPLSMTPPPAEKAVAAPHSPASVGPSIPTPGSQSLADVVAALESDDWSSPPPTRSRTPTGQRFRQSNTGIGRLAANSARRPQASAEPPTPPPSSSRGPLPSVPRRGSTEADAYDVETEVGKDDWKATLAVEDEQLVDWSSSEETATTTGDDGFGRKR